MYTMSTWSNQSNKLQALILQLQNYADEVTKERNLVTFAPKDIEQVVSVM